MPLWADEFAANIRHNFHIRNIRLPIFVAVESLSVWQWRKSAVRCRGNLLILQTKHFFIPKI